MLMLLAIIGLMQSRIQRLLLWLFAPSRQHYGCKLPNSSSGDNHCHSTKKPEWSSRVLQHLQALRDKTSRTLIACISKVILIYGKPKIIRTDNEAIFTFRASRRGLKLLGIRHQLTDPGCPWQNGRIERLFGTLKQKLDQIIYSPLPQEGEGLGERVRKQLNCDLNTFRYWYNHIRPHQNLNGKTPTEVWNGGDPYTKPPKQEYWFEAWDGLLAGYCLRR